MERQPKQGSIISSQNHYFDHPTLPMSVTLTALNKVLLFSSTTAILLTPSSLINFMASRIVLEEVAETTLRFSEGSESDWIGLERYS